MQTVHVVAWTYKGKGHSFAIFFEKEKANDFFESQKNVDLNVVLSGMTLYQFVHKSASDTLEGVTDEVSDNIIELTSKATKVWNYERE